MESTSRMYEVHPAVFDTKTLDTLIGIRTRGISLEASVIFPLPDHPENLSRSVRGLDQLPSEYV